MLSNTTATNNTATGLGALRANTTGDNNTATGSNALLLNTTGNNNVALGPGAGNKLTTGSNNVDIANRGVAGESNTIRIGTVGTQIATYLAGVTGHSPAGAVQTVVINRTGKARDPEHPDRHQGRVGGDQRSSGKAPARRSGAPAAPDQSPARPDNRARAIAKPGASMSKPLKSTPSPSMIVALIALFVALGGTAVALDGSNTVFSDDIVNGEVYSGDVRNDTLAGGGLAAVDLQPGGTRSERRRFGTTPPRAVASGPLICVPGRLVPLRSSTTP